uniref:Uncharacterized protein n=1 Tax=Knipowitschia caucasica TaxID=637954 RepID=A0AAV2MTH5_KNICA
MGGARGMGDREAGLMQEWFSLGVGHTALAPRQIVCGPDLARQPGGGTCKYTACAGSSQATEIYVSPLGRSISGSPESRGAGGQGVAAVRACSQPLPVDPAHVLTFTLRGPGIFSLFDSVSQRNGVCDGSEQTTFKVPIWSWRRWFLASVVPGVGGSWRRWFLASVVPGVGGSWRRWFLASVVPGVGGSWRRWFLASVVPGVSGSWRQWFLASVVPGVSGSWRQWFLASVVPGVSGSWRQWFLASVVPGVSGSWRQWFLASVVPNVGGSWRQWFLASVVPGVSGS